MSRFDDPAGVLDGYDEERLQDAMYEPHLEAATEWVEIPEGRRLRMTCPECDVSREFETRPATARCKECLRIMQAADYDAGSTPDPENPDWYLEKVARRRGKLPDAYKQQAEPQSARSW